MPEAPSVNTPLEPDSMSSQIAAALSKPSLDFCQTSQTSLRTSSCARVKLVTISEGDYSFAIIDAAKDGESRCNWFKELQKCCSDSALGNQLIVMINGDLFEHPDAKHFRALHGHAAHYLTPTLISGVNRSYSAGDAVSIQTYTAPIDLPNELAIIDRHRLRIQNAYELFGDYATALHLDYESLLAKNDADI